MNLASTVTGEYGKGSGGVRFTLIMAFIAVAILAGLYVYGQMLEPQTRTIEVEAQDAA